MTETPKPDMTTTIDQVAAHHPASPVSIRFDAAAALEWMLGDGAAAAGDLLESYTWTGDGGTPGDSMPDAMSDMIAHMPASVLALGGCTLSIDGIYDMSSYLVRVHVTLPTGVTLAGSIEETAHLLARASDFTPEGLKVGGVVLPLHEEHTAAGAVFFLAEVVTSANRCIDDLYLSLQRVAEGRRDYIAGAPDSVREHLKSEVAALEAAAGAVVGDPATIRGLLPSWRWEPTAAEMVAQDARAIAQAD